MIWFEVFIVATCTIWLSVLMFASGSDLSRPDVHKPIKPSNPRPRRPF